MFLRQDLKRRAKQAFKKNYGPAVLVALILAFISGSLVTSGSSSRFGKNVYNSGNILNSEKEAKIYEEIYGENVEDSSITKTDDDGFFGLLGFPITEIFAPAFLGVFFIITTIVLIIAIFLNALIFNPLKVGCKRFFILNADGYPTFREMGYAFKTNYWNIVKVMFITDVYLLLWSLLFVIPGIVKSYSYHLVPYLLAENPDLTVSEAIGTSKEIMDGYKFFTFVLDLSFFGWNLLESLTFGLSGVLYSNPYYYATHSELYLALTNEEKSRAF